MGSLSKSRFVARVSSTTEDILACQRLRYIAFVDGTAESPCDDARDEDAFDLLCQHILIVDRMKDELVACFRVLPLYGDRDICMSYAAQFYELGRLSKFPGRMLEMGRFCVAPWCNDPDILRVAWAALTAHVDRDDVALLFGCSSFHGTRAEDYLDAFAILKDRHIAPRRWLPKVKAPNVFRFAKRPRRKPDNRRGMRTMPPLLRSYLAMGGWVSDHAVVDKDLGTLHVFTGLEIAAIPPARARVLRAAVG